MDINDSEVTVPPIIIASNNTAKQPALSETVGFPGVAPKDIAERLVAIALNDMISHFIDATSNDVLKTAACRSCARETSLAECEEIPLKDILTSIT